MRRNIVFAIILIALLVIVGCTPTTTPEETDTTKTTPGAAKELPTDNKIALSTYIAGGVLASRDKIEQTPQASRMILPLQTEEELKIEKILSEVNVYFDRLKFFLDEGVEGIVVQERASSREGYEVELNYQIDDEQYTIYYNEVSKDRLTGLLLYNNVEFELIGEIENEEEEYEIKFKAIDTTNEANWVEIELETEDESDEYEFESQMKMVINGAYKEVKVEYSVENEEQSIELEINDNGDISQYEFDREQDDGGIVYKIEYEVENVQGEVAVLETVDETGNPIYRYKIEEEGKRKDIDFDRDDDDDD